jgi:hypothetical protein
MDAKSGWCEGCLRTIEEITLWSRWDDESKRAVWAQLPARQAIRLQQATLPPTRTVP